MSRRLVHNAAALVALVACAEAPRPDTLRPPVDDFNPACASPTLSFADSDAKPLSGRLLLAGEVFEGQVLAGGCVERRVSVTVASGDATLVALGPSLGAAQTFRVSARAPGRVVLRADVEDLLRTVELELQVVELPALVAGSSLPPGCDGVFVGDVVACQPREGTTIPLVRLGSPDGDEIETGSRWSSLLAVGSRLFVASQTDTGSVLTAHDPSPAPTERWRVPLPDTSPPWPCFSADRALFLRHWLDGSATVLEVDAHTDEYVPLFEVNVDQSFVECAATADGFVVHDKSSWARYAPRASPVLVEQGAVHGLLGFDLEGGWITVPVSAGVALGAYARGNVSVLPLEQVVTILNAASRVGVVTTQHAFILERRGDALVPIAAGRLTGAVRAIAAFDGRRLALSGDDGWSVVYSAP